VKCQFGQKIQIFQSNGGGEYEDKCFSAAVLLINILPSPILKMESPFYYLFGKQLDYRLYGCLGIDASHSLVVIQRLN